MTRENPTPENGPNWEEQSAQPLDLSKVVAKRRNMLNPEVVLSWDTYFGRFTALGARLLTQLAVDLGKGAQPPELYLSELAKGSMDLAGQPVIERGPTTLPIIWRERDEKKQPELDVTRLIMSGRITVPHGHRGYIPLIRQPVTGLKGDAMVLKISEIRYAPILKDRSRKNNNAGSTVTGPQAQTSHPTGALPPPGPKEAPPGSKEGSPGPKEGPSGAEPGTGPRPPVGA